MESLEELLDLSGKAALVTGGGKGIGKAICYRLAEAGAAVLVADMDETAAKATALELASKGCRVAAFKADVSDEKAVKDMVRACVQQLGSLDILVNNAGIYPAKPISQMTVKDFEKVMRVNLESVFMTTKYASEQMKKTGKGGRIINITSIDALHPSMAGLAHYDASKHGEWGFTKNAALELAPYKIWVNAIAPGGIKTPGTETLQTASESVSNVYSKDAVEAFLAKIPMHRMGEPDEVGRVVLFLTSELASYMTGSQIVVDGGALLT